MSESETFEGFALVEIMGHRRLAGYVREASIAGQGFIRLDIPSSAEPGHAGVALTQYYPPASLYCLTPVSEEIARRFAVNNQPVPVQRWELPAPQAEAANPSRGQTYRDLEDAEPERDEEDDLVDIPFY